jgi:hypothetical protein
MMRQLDDAQSVCIFLLSRNCSHHVFSDILDKLMKENIPISPRMYQYIMAGYIRLGWESHCDLQSS